MTPRYTDIFQNSLEKLVKNQAKISKEALQKYHGNFCQKPCRVLFRNLRKIYPNVLQEFSSEISRETLKPSYQKNLVKNYVSVARNYSMGLFSNSD